MDLATRIQRYKAIEEYRGQPLIVYATSTRQGVPARMAGDAVREFIDQIEQIDHGSKVDVLIHSTGGDALTAWKLMSLLRERFSSVTVLVPFMAFSAATIFSLGADEIIMHPNASLGPIDPQITIRSKDGQERQFSFEDLGAFLRFVQEEVGISEQVHLTSIVDKLFSTVDPVGIGGAKRASELSTDVGERLLQMHMKDAEQRPQARSIAEGLNKSFFAHGDAVSRTRARELKLKVAKDDKELETLLWDAFLAIEDYMGFRSAFNPLQHFLANGGAQALQPVPPIQLPADTPPQVAQAVWNQVAQQALQSLANPGVEVPFSVINAIIESPRAAAEFRTDGTISGARVAGGEIQLPAIDRSSGWGRVQVPTDESVTTPTPTTTGTAHAPN